MRRLALIHFFELFVNLLSKWATATSRLLDHIICLLHKYRNIQLNALPEKTSKLATVFSRYLFRTEHQLGMFLSLRYDSTVVLNPAIPTAKRTLGPPHN